MVQKRRVSCDPLTLTSQGDLANTKRPLSDPSTFIPPALKSSFKALRTLACPHGRGAKFINRLDHDLKDIFSKRRVPANRPGAKPAEHCRECSRTGGKGGGAARSEDTAEPGLIGTAFCIKDQVSIHVAFNMYRNRCFLYISTVFLESFASCSLCKPLTLPGLTRPPS